MAVTTAVLSGNVADLTGTADPAVLATARLSVEPNTTSGALLDTAGNKVMVGLDQIAVNSTTGAFSHTLVRTDSADIIPAAGRMYRVHLDYREPEPGGSWKRTRITSGWFTLTADAGLASKWTGIETLVVPSSANLDDVAMTNVDALPASTFRAQQDARLSNTFVEQNSQAWDVRDHGVPIDGVALADTALTTLLAAMSPGDTLRIPPGATIKLATRADISKKIIVDGNDATITQASATGALRVTAAGGGTQIRNLKGVGPSGTVYAAASIFILVEGAVAGYAEDVKLDNVRGEAWGYGTLEGRWARRIHTRDVFTKNCYYVGQSFLSCDDTTVDNPMCDTLTGIAAGDSYPVTFTRDSSLTLAAAPRSKGGVVNGGWSRNTTWEAVECHGAEDIKVFGHKSYKTKMGVAFTRSPDTAGVPTYAPLNCWAFGCTADSGVSDGSARDGFMLVGAGSIEKATGGFVGCTAIGHGDQAHASAMSGGFYLLDTKGAHLSASRAVEGSVNSLVLDQGNTDVFVNDFAAIDPWSTVSGAVAGLKMEGVGQSVLLSGFRVLAGTKTATNLRTVGIRASSADTTSRIYDGGGNDFTAAGSVFANAATEALLRTGWFGKTGARPALLTAAPAAAPAGGVGTAAGGWDTAANRDAAIVTINGVKTRVDELETRLRAIGLLT